jgi:hypothetical protein
MLGIGNVWGQTTLISPTGDGGFESGTTFAANGWTTVNATTNIWVCGSSSSGSPLANWWSGSRGAFISNNSGTNWAYTNSTVQRSHIYRDISFPAGETTITLTFDWRGNGNDGDYDNLQVYIMNTTITPTTSGPTGTNTTTTGWSGYTNGTTGYYLTKINGTSSPTSTTTITYNFTAAQGTFCAGSTKRLVFTWKNDGYSGTNPPAGIDNITLTSSCTGAVTAAASAIAATSATANWTAFAGATSYDLRHRAVGAPSWTTLTTLAGTSTSLSSLTSNTNYEYQVKANGPVCNAWSSSRTFSTLCNPYSIPYSEGFESGYTHNTTLAGCLSQSSVTGTGVWTSNNTLTDYNRTPRTGGWNAFLAWSNEDWLFVPVSLTGGTSYTASVYARQDGSTTTNANIAISYGTTNSAAGMTNSVVSATGINASYQLISGAFTPSSTGTYYIGIKGFMNGTPFYISIDDISIDLTPSCLAPTITATTSIAATTATINWTAASPAPSGGYQWEVRTSGAGGSGGAGLVASGTVAAGVLTASATGLTASTAYTVYVRSDCGGSGFSTWASGGAFTTLKAEPTNQVTALAAGTVSASAIPLTWTAAAAGAQAPDGYLIKASDASLAAIADPSDGTDPSDVTAFTSGSANKKQTTGAATSTTSFTSMTAGTMYYYKVYSYTNSGTGINFNITSPATLNHATLPNAATAPVFSTTTFTGTTLTWTAPAAYNASNHTTLVFVKATSAVTAGTPTSDPASYTANTTFASGTAFQGDASAYCVYSGDGTSVTITGLSASTTYHVRILTVVDAANSNGNRSYSTGLVGDVTTLKAEPTNQITALTAGAVTASAIPLTWTAAVAGAQAPDGYLIKASDASLGAIADPSDGTDPVDVTAFTSGAANKEQTTGSATSTTSFTSMTAGTMYYYKVYSYTNSGTAIDFNVTSPATLNHATLPNEASLPVFSATAATGTTISWTAPAAYNASNHTTLVFVKATSAVTAGTPTSDPASYTANTTFASGTAFQGDASAYCVYSGDGTSVTITGLSAATTYHVRILTVVDAANSNGNRSYSTGLVGNVTTLCSAPSVTGTTPAARCGTGAVTLAAAASSGTLRWFKAATADTLRGTGASFVTPSIASTTDYYVEAASIGTTSFGGKLTPETSWTGYTSSDWGIVFNVLKEGTLNSVDVYSSAAGTLNVKIVNSSNTELYSTGNVSVTNGGTTTPTTIPLNYSIGVGTGYKVLVKASSGVSLIRGSTNLAFPYTNSDLSITSSEWGGTTTANYYYFHNFNFSPVCASARTLVTATVTPAPALALDSPNFTICKGATSTAVSVTPATLPDYNTFSWTPTTGVSSPSSSSTTFSPSATTTYTLNASHSGTGCARSLTRTITMADTPSRLTLSQGFVKPKCDARIDSLMASGGLLSSSGVIGTATTLTGSTTQPTAFCNRWRSYWHQMVFTPSELTSLGMTAGSQINSLRFNITTLGDGTNVTNATIRIGNAALSTLSAFQTTGLTQVFSASTYTHTIGLNIFNFSSPYTWDGSSNLLVELFHNGADITNNSQTYFTATAGNTSVTAATSTNHANVAAYAAVNPTATPSTSRINTTFGFSVQQNITWSPSGAGSGLFTDRAATTHYTSGSATKVYSRPSTTTKYYAEAQNGACIVRDSIIDSAKATTDMVILALGSASGASAQCTDGGWTYYGTAADPDKLIFAIQKGAWTNGNETVTIGVNGSPYSSTLASNGPNQQHRSWLMGRDWDVTVSTQPSTPVLVRFFYDPADTTAVNTDRDAAFAALPGGTLAVKTPFEWFKTTNVPYNAGWRSSIVGNKFPATHIKLTPTYGTQNGVNYVEFSVASFSGGTGGAGFGPSGGGGAGVGLPVTWAGFDVKTAEVGNELTWKTASEQNTDYFEVQYSYDAKEFIAIPEHISAAGNSADLRTYNFTHTDFAPYVYYRIKQVDLDGKFDYSAIKLAKRAAGPSFVVNVFPIPMQEDNLLHVSAKGIDKSTMSITMTDITGKVIRHLSYIPSSESIKESFDMSPLTPGLYFIEVQNGQGKETFKVSR